MPPAFEAARALSEQLLTLSTGILAVTVTFIREPVAKTSRRGRMALTGSWVCHLASILCGIWELMALAGTLEPLAGEAVSIRGSNVTLPSALQIIAFFGATLLLVAFAVITHRCAHPLHDR